MKKNIINITKCVSFLLVLLFLLYGSSLLVMPKDNSGDAGIHYLSAMGYLAEPEDSMDILFLGDSLIYSGVSPLYMWNKYGITSYDCSIPSQKFVFANKFCKTFLEKQSPKIVFIETDTIFRNLSPEDLATFYAEQIFSVFSYHNRWKSLNKRDLNPKIEYTRIEPFRGYRLSTKVNGAKLVILSMPCQKNWNYKIHNGAEEAAKKLGIDYLDLNLVKDGLNMDWAKDTRDKGEHLNNYGAEKVSDYLGKYITSLGLTADKRNMAGFESWNESHQKLQNEIDAELIKNAMK